MYVSIFNEVSCTLNAHRRNLDALACSDSAGFRGGGQAQGPLQTGAPNYVHVFSHTCDMCVPLVAFISEESLFVDGKTLLIGSPDAVLHLYLYTCLDAVYYLIL